MVSGISRQAGRQAFKFTDIPPSNIVNYHIKWRRGPHSTK